MDFHTQSRTAPLQSVKQRHPQFGHTCASDAPQCTQYFQLDRFSYLHERHNFICAAGCAIKPLLMTTWRSKRPGCNSSWPRQSARMVVAMTAIGGWWSSPSISTTNCFQYRSRSWFEVSRPIASRLSINKIQGDAFLACSKICLKILRLLWVASLFLSTLYSSAGRSRSSMNMAPVMPRAFQQASK